MIDPAIVLVTKNSPTLDHHDAIILFDDIASVEPTEYALPLEVRVASRFVWEISMGFAPTYVQSKGGKEFILNGSTPLFYQDEVKGTDIRLAGKGLPSIYWRVELFDSKPHLFSPSGGYDPIPIASYDYDLVTHVFADWFDGASKLDKASQLAPLVLMYHQNPWYGKGIKFQRIGRPEEAIECFDKAIEVNADFADAWYEKGTALYKLGRYRKAKRCFRKAKELGYAELGQMLELLEKEGH